MKRRGPLYDTRTYELENRDLSQGIVLTLIVIALNHYSTQENHYLLAPVTAVFAYLAALLSSSRTRMMLPVALVISVLALPVNVLLTLRIAMFSAALALLPRRRVSSSPIFMLLVLWGVYLNNRSIQSLLGVSLPLTLPVSVREVTDAFFEIFGMLITLLLLWSKRFPALLGRTTGEIELSSIIFSLLLLASLCAIALTTTVYLFQSDLTLEGLISLKSGQSLPLLLLALGGLIIPLALSVALSNMFKDFTSRLEQLLVAGGGAVATPRVRDFLKIISRARELLDGFDHQIRALELNSKNQAIQAKERELSLLQDAQDAKNIAEAMALSPTGFLALTGSGAILSYNATFCTQFNFESSQQLIGEHFSALTPQPDRPNRKEVLNSFIAQLLADQGEIAKGIPLESSLSLDDETFAQITLYLIEGELLPVDQKRLSPQIRPSNITLLLFTQIREEVRPLILRQFRPAALELLAVQGIESLKEISSQASKALADVCLSNDKLGGLSQMSADDLEAELRIIDRGIKELLTDFRGLSEVILKRTKAKHLSKEELSSLTLTKVSLTPHLERVLKLFEELTAQNGVTQFQPPTVIDANQVETVMPMPLMVDETAFYRFSAMLVSTLAAISQRIPGKLIQISLGSEQIGTGTSALFSGSYPGRYLRIVISHSGQSITANMMPESVTRLGDPDKIAGSLEGVLALLSFYIEQLHGFLSIQSSPAKGTHLTFYLPEDPRALDFSARPQSRKIAANHIQPADENTPLPESAVTSTAEVSANREEDSVLVVSDEDPLCDELLRHLAECGLTNARKAKISEVYSSTEDLSGLAGSGFSDGGTDLFQSTLDLSRFALIVIPIIGNLSAGMRLLKTIGPGKPLLIVTDDEESADALSTIHRVISYPVDQQSLRSVIDSLR